MQHCALYDPGMTAIGYVRVSTEQQADSGLSIEAQRRKVAAQAVVSDAELVGIVEDAGASAKTLDRPGWSRVADMVSQGAVDVVIVAKLDRCTRSVSDLGTLLDQLGKARRADGGRAWRSSPAPRAWTRPPPRGASWSTCSGPSASGSGKRSGSGPAQPAGEAPPGSPALQRQPLRVPLVRRSPRGGCRRAVHARHDRQLPLRRSVVGQGRRRAERHRAPHPHRRQWTRQAPTRSTKRAKRGHGGRRVSTAQGRRRTSRVSGHHQGAAGALRRALRTDYAAMMPSRFSLAINSAWLPAPLRRLQEPHSNW